MLALDFSRAGWRVGIHCWNSTSAAEELESQIKADGGSAAVLRADLANPLDVAGLVPRCAAALGPPSCLVNNASMFANDDLATLDPHLWDAQHAVNLRAPVFLSKAFAEHLPASTPGNIINMIDQRVWKPTPQFFSYSASKAGLWSVTRTLAQALAPRIRVNAIGPGPTLRGPHQTASDFRKQFESTILKRGTNGEEIAAAVRFILDAPAMTGQMIALDGGQHLAWDTPDIDSPRN